MGFKMKYDITKDLLPNGTHRRPGIKLNRVGFLVAHDTGNPSSTAKGNVNYYKNSPTIYASAHLFVDDKDIIECIPAVTGKPETAYHVIYDVTTDNARFGDDANDIAIGVELCWGGKINGDKAYARYVWILAYLCYKFGLDPKRDIVGHEQLDPKRKIDPSNGLKHIGRTYNKLITDVVAEYKACTGKTSTPTKKASAKTGKTHKVVKGETLYAIAKDYSTTIAKLKALNPEIDINVLKIGQVLTVSKTASAPAKKGDMKTTSVVDYLKSIGKPTDIDYRKTLAKKYGITNYIGSASQNAALLKKLRG